MGRTRGIATITMVLGLSCIVGPASTSASKDRTGEAAVATSTAVRLTGNGRATGQTTTTTSTTPTTTPSTTPSTSTSISTSISTSTTLLISTSTSTPTFAPIVTVPPSTSITTMAPSTTVVTPTTTTGATTTGATTTSIAPTTPTSTVADGALQLRRFAVPDAGGSWLGYCSTTDLATGAASAATELVVVIHGTDRNACDYAAWTSEAAVLAGHPGAIVVAPHFVTSDDPEAAEPGAFVWTSGGWKSGSASRAGGTTPLSSYDVLDRMITSVVGTNRFSGIRTVTVVGHSAGGQFVNRYAAVSTVQPGVPMRFVVANPSSYLYLDGRRPSGGSFGDVTTSQLAACPEYDSYKYGLHDLYEYPARLGSEAIRARAGSTDVVYLLGELDVEQDNDLDVSCAGALQGANRFERGVAYFAHMGALYGPSLGDHQRLEVVPGVGHQARKMFTSLAGLRAIFP